MSTLSDLVNICHMLRTRETFSLFIDMRNKKQNSANDVHNTSKAAIQS